MPLSAQLFYPGFDFPQTVSPMPDQLVGFSHGFGDLGELCRQPQVHLGDALICLIDALVGLIDALAQVPARLGKLAFQLRSRLGQLFFQGERQ